MDAQYLTIKELTEAVGGDITPRMVRHYPDGATGRLKTRQGCDSRQIAGKKIG